MAAAAVTGGRVSALMQTSSIFRATWARGRPLATAMEPAGFTPEGFAGMFDKLSRPTRLNDNGSGRICAATR